MNDETALAIEMQPGSLTGIIRGPHAGSPDLAAYRPEAWRFLRLSRVLGAAAGMILAELGEATVKEFAGAILRLEDAKGDFTAYWRDDADRHEFREAVRRALLLEGEQSLVHSRASDLQD